MSNKQLYNAISLFSGAGGMDIGFQKAGISPLLANDIDIDACKSYHTNHPHCKVLHGDINQYKSDFKKHKGIDFLFGGPPCQGFSVAGKMNPHDSRNQLLLLFAEMVNLCSPKFFVCENVKALATLSKWDDVRKSFFIQTEQNYSVGMVLLNSKEFGVPQNRERVFFVGFHKDLLRTSRQNIETLLFEKLKTQKNTPPPLQDIIRQLGPAGSHLNKRSCKAKITFAKVPVLRRSPYAGMLFNGSGRPLPSTGHSCTLPASMGGNKTPFVDEGVIFKSMDSFVEQYHKHLTEGGKPYTGEAPQQLRRLTVDESLAIQTFPADYYLHGKQSSIYRQIGNAVPARLAEAVAKSVIHTYESV